MNQISETIASMLGSKKFLATVVGVILSILSSKGILIPEEALIGVLAPIFMYIFGQGLADIGKEYKPTIVQQLSENKPPAPTPKPVAPKPAAPPAK